MNTFLICCTHLETEADGRDDAERGGPGADPAHRQEETQESFSRVHKCQKNKKTLLLGRHS